MGREAFFEPCMKHTPSSFRPPLIRQMSIKSPPACWNQSILCGGAFFCEVRELYTLLLRGLDLL